MTTSTVHLSRAYSSQLYRGSKGITPKYYPASGAVSCDECSARQHEAHRTTQHPQARGRARTKRVITGAAPTPDRVLFLCGPDTERWRERDLTDGVTTR